MEANARGLALDEVRATVAAGEAFADYLRGETEVSAASVAAKVGSVAHEEFFRGSGDWCKVEVRQGAGRGGRGSTGGAGAGGGVGAGAGLAGATAEGD